MVEIQNGEEPRQREFVDAILIYNATYTALGLSEDTGAGSYTTPEMDFASTNKWWYPDIHFILPTGCNFIHNNEPYVKYTDQKSREVSRLYYTCDSVREEQENKPTAATVPVSQLSRNEIVKLIGQNLAFRSESENLQALGYISNNELTIMDGPVEGIYNYETKFTNAGGNIVILSGQYSEGTKDISIRRVGDITLVENIKADPLEFAKENLEIVGAIIGGLGVLAGYIPKAPYDTDVIIFRFQ